MTDPPPSVRIALAIHRKIVVESSPAERVWQYHTSNAMTSTEPTARDLFEVLVREHGELLLVSIRAMAGSALADDIFQETVLVAWRRIGDYDRTRPFGPWLRGIARLVALDLLSRDMNPRERTARQRVHLADPNVLDAIERDCAALDRACGVGPEPAMTFRERLAALDRCLGRLPPTYAEAVQGAYRDDHTLAQLAVSLGENEETLKKRLQRGRALLAECLRASGLFGDDASGPARFGGATT